MKNVFRRLMKFAAYAAAGVVILLAIAVGLFRLFLPRLPEYQDDIKGWASAAIGMNVEFSGMDARWGLSGPEVEFYNAELISSDNMARIVAAKEVSVSVGLMRLLVDRKLVVDRIVVRESSIEVRQLDNGQWWIQGSPPDQLMPAGIGDGSGTGEIEIIGEDIELQFLQPGDERPRVFRVARLLVSRDDARLAVDATVDLPQDLGGLVTVAATQIHSQDGAEASWDVSVEADDIELVGVSALHTAAAAQFDSGSGDLDMSLAIANGKVQSVAADVDFRDISIAGETGLAFNGHLEFRDDTDGWLVAATDYQLETAAGAWPTSSLRVETGTGGEGQITMIDVRASFLRLADIDVLQPWLGIEQNNLIAAYDPDGVVRDLVVTVSDVDTDSPRYDVSAEFVDVGVAPVDDRSGVRGFSGRLRADRSGGRLEIDSHGLAVSLPPYLTDAVEIDDASGTVIWRRGNSRTTVLSDSIVFRNEDFDFETNIEVTLIDDSSAPIVDLASTFSISDIARAKRYVPFIPRVPKTSEWLQEGLLAGRIPHGTVRLYGPMDKFPFAGGEGRFFVAANLRDASILYHRRWPTAEIIDLDIAIENTRLYSERNHIITVGNEVSNAHIEIADLSSPVLTINADSTGTLESVRQLIAQSPIGTDVFSGKLDRVAVSGDGSFSLDLRVPIRDVQSFEFTSRLQTSNGSLQMEGFAPPVSNLSGVVTIQREDISSESLGGVFLGRPVAIELMPAPESMPNYRVIAVADGTATAEGLTEGLGLPLSGFVTGETAYASRLLFPRGKLEVPPPFTIEVTSDLTGLDIDFPMPFRKPINEAIGFTASIELPQGSELINTSGNADGLMSWHMVFAKEAERWDFDRGVVTFGGETTATAGTRGLHLRGTTDYVALQDWLDLGRQRNDRNGASERIRSIDMTVGNLHLLGQHIVDHRVRVDRSALDWLVQFDGADIAGSVFVPYDFNSGRTLVIEMDRLVLPGNEEDRIDPREQIDPRGLPPISIKAAEFAFGDRFLGKVDATFERTADGLESANLLAKDESFEVVGSGRWIVDESDPAGHRSYVKAALTSSNVERTMERLAYDPGIVSDELSMLLDLSWSGGPREEFMDTLDGEVKLRIGKGQLDDVEPGAGRVFGLMSVVALPRRLALDFRDVFSKGFGFDKISATFRIVDGETYTCNLSLEGPAAAIGIVGRAGLVSRDYDQAAMVNANFGNTLPVVGGVLGGPQLAAVLLVFSQIFKKPLQEVSQIYYGISGSWDDPQIDTLSAEAFAANGALAGCIDDAE